MNKKIIYEVQRKDCEALLPSHLKDRAITLDCFLSRMGEYLFEHGHLIDADMAAYYNGQLSVLEFGIVDKTVWRAICDLYGIWFDVYEDWD